MSAVIEEVYKEGLALRLGLRSRLFAGKSEFQSVEIYESTHHGRVLLNDGAFMLSERDERIYHEMMAHVPLHVHPRARRVLIIGGGDGGTAREVLRHQTVERCVMVEIDRMVVDACREFIPQTAGALSDPRLELRFEDGVAYVRESREEFDVILVDSTDPNGMAQPLFGPEFYADVARRLAPDGIVVAQGESVFYETAMQKQLMQTARAQFPLVGMYNFTNMLYPGGLWSFLYASRGLHPLRDQRPSELEMFYYTPELHRAAFARPKFQEEALAPWTTL